MSSSECKTLREPLLRMLLLCLVAFAWAWWTAPLLVSGLWLDEFATWWVAHRSFSDAIGNTRPFPPHPTYYGLMHFVMTIFGDSEEALRILSFIFFLWSCSLLGRLISGLVSNLNSELVTFTTAFAMLFNQPLASLCLQARPYALGIWATLYSFYLISRFKEDHSRRSATLKIAGFTLLALGSHPLFFVILPLQALLLWAAFGSPMTSAGFKKIVITQSLVSILGILIFALCGALDRSIVIDGFNDRSSDVSSLLLLAHTLYKPTIFGVLVGLVTWLTWIRRKQTKPDYEKRRTLRIIIFFVAWSLVPYLALGSQTIFTGKVLYERYACVGYLMRPIFHSLMTAFVLSLMAPRMRIAFGTLIAVLICLSSIASPLHIKENYWREMSQWILDRVDAHSLVILRLDHVQSNNIINPDPQELSAWFAPLFYYGVSSHAKLSLFKITGNENRSDGWPTNEPVEKSIDSVFFLCRTADLKRSCDETATESFSPERFARVDHYSRMEMGVYRWAPVKQ